MNQSDTKKKRIHSTVVKESLTVTCTDGNFLVHATQVQKLSCHSFRSRSPSECARRNGRSWSARTKPSDLSFVWSHEEEFIWLRIDVDWMRQQKCKQHIELCSSFAALNLNRATVARPSTAGVTANIWRVASESRGEWKIHETERMTFKNLFLIYQFAKLESGVRFQNKLSRLSGFFPSSIREHVVLFASALPFID